MKMEDSNLGNCIPGSEGGRERERERREREKEKDEGESEGEGIEEEGGS